MKAYTYIDKGKFELIEKPKPVILEGKDAIVRVTLRCQPVDLRRKSDGKDHT